MRAPGMEGMEAVLAGEWQGMAGWADSASGGDRAMAGILLAAVSRFLRRHGSSFLENPAPGWLALVRIDRAAAALTDGGLVRSAEFFHIHDIGAFEGGAGERSAALDAASWDDRAALFTRRQPPRRTREEPPSLDWDGAACLRALPGQIRRIEYLLNGDLAGDRRASHVLEEAPPQNPDGHRHIRHGIRTTLEAALRVAQGDAAAAALAAFRGCLDADRLRAMAGAGANSARCHNWLCGQDRLGRDAVLAMRRTQAALAYPVAWPLIAAPVGLVAAAVADARPLVPELALAFGVSETAVRRMGGLTAAAAGLDAPDACGAERVARTAARMPQGAPPRTEAGWLAFFAAVRLADAASATGGASPGLLETAAGRWDSLDAEAVHQAAAGFADMAADLHANLGQPFARGAGVRGWNLAGTAAAIFGGMAIPRIVAASAWWHAAQAGIRTHLGQAFPPPGQPGGANAWPPLHTGGAWTAPNGLVIEVLADRDSLLGEHVRMEHCINGYAPNCLLGGCHILSVRRTGDRTPVGTAEISQDALLPLAGTAAEPPDALLTRLPPGVVQFRARRNGMPAQDGWEALWAYVGAILTGALAIDAEGLAAALAMRRASAGPHAGRWPAA